MQFSSLICKGKHKKRHRMHVYSNILVRLGNNFVRGKATNFTYSELIYIAFSNQQAKLHCHFILPQVPCLSVPTFSTLSHKRHNYQ